MKVISNKTSQSIDEKIIKVQVLKLTGDARDFPKNKTQNQIGRDYIKNREVVQNNDH